MPVRVPLSASILAILGLIGCDADRDDLPAPAAGAPTAGASDAVPSPHASAPGLAHAIDAVYPALVQIYVLHLMESDGRDRKQQAAGSGVIISADGLVVTNYHVAGHTADIRCVLSDREELRASLVGADALTDLAVLRLDLAHRHSGAPLHVASFGSSAALKVGDPVLAMGCPLAISQSVTAGIVANVDMVAPRTMGAVEIDGENVGSTVTWIVHDAQIYPGNSGGPLVDIDGRVVGINEISLGLGGSIPADLVKGVVAQLVAHGKVQRAYFGVAFQPLLKGEIAAGRDRGVLVGGVLPGSPAAGLLESGDLVLAVNGAPARARFDEELPAFMNRLLSSAPNVPVSFAVLRGGESRTVTVTPIARDEARAREVESREWGMTVRRITMGEAEGLHRPDTAGVLVSSIRPGAAADAALPNLRPGDIILTVGATPTPTVAAFLAATPAGLQGASDGIARMSVRYARGAEELLTVAEVGVRPPLTPPEHAHHGWLAAQSQVLSPPLAEALGLKGRMGVRLTEVYDGGPASRAGLKVGDILTRIDDQNIEASTAQDASLFDSMVRQYKPGDAVALLVWRDAASRRITATLADAPGSDQEVASWSDTVNDFSARDLTFDDRHRRRWGPEVVGALVSQVDNGGWAAVAGLNRDELIIAVDGRPVASCATLVQAMAAAEARHDGHIVLLVRRGDTTGYIEIQPANSAANSANP